MNTNTDSFHTSRGYIFIDTDQIVRMEASSNYTHVYLANKQKLVMARVLRTFENELAVYGFIRTHRTHLVNRRHIRAVTPGGAIIMKDDSRAEISRRLKHKVMRCLRQAS